MIHGDGFKPPFNGDGSIQRQQSYIRNVKKEKKIK
jgi:hypothetical protein